MVKSLKDLSDGTSQEEGTGSMPVSDVQAGSGIPAADSGMNQAARPVEEEVIGNMALQEALATLKDGERQIVNMKVLGDMTFREIAETLQMPMGTVTWKYQNAIGKLRRCGYE